MTFLYVFLVIEICEIVRRNKTNSHEVLYSVSKLVCICLVQMKLIVA